MIRTPKVTRSHDRPVSITGWRGVYSSLGYRAVRLASSEGRSYLSYPGETHNERDRKKLIAQSRDFMRNNAIYKGMIEQMIDRVVGDGFKLQVTASKSLTAKVEGLWRDWFRRPEIRNVLNGGETVQMICRELAVAGDVTVLKTDKSVIQLFEAEQLDGMDRFEAGISKDKYGRPQRYHLCPWKKHAVDVRNGISKMAGDILFITTPERPSQLRGVPPCQAAFPMLHRINDVCDSEAIAWQMLSRMAVAISRKEGAALAYTESRADPEKSDDQLEGDLATRLTELDYALIFHGEPGEEVRGIERTIPGDNFSESLRAFLRLLGLPLGLPLELILLDWTNSNYSQSRAVLEQAYVRFTRWQEKIEDWFYRPLFDWKLEQWRDEGLIAARAPVQAEWIKPTYPWIDQVKEAQAQATKVDRGYITHNHVCKSLNLDRDEVVGRRVKEVTDAIEKAAAIEEQTGEKVPWQIFAGLAPPKVQSAPAGGKQNTPEQKDEGQD